MARPIICSTLFILYHGSKTCICLIYLKSKPSLPAADRRITLTFSPSTLLESVHAFKSPTISGEILLFPLIITYLAPLKRCPGTCNTSDFFL